MDWGFSKNTTITTKDYINTYERFLVQLEIERQRKIKREKANDDDLFDLFNELKREGKQKIQNVNAPSNQSKREH